MHIKKFEAKGLQEALGHIRTELGEDALILETRNGSHGRIEVTAALPHSASGSSSSIGAPIAEPAQAVASPTGAGSVKENVADILARLPQDQVQAALGYSAYAKQLGRGKGTGDSVTSGSGVDSSTETPESLAGSTPRSTGRIQSAMRAAQPARSQDETLKQELESARARVSHLGRLVRSEHFSLIPAPLRDLYLDLSEAGLDANLLFELLTRMGDAPIDGEFKAAAPEILVSQLSNFLRIGGAVSSTEGRRVIALVGPTGVGKTTTLAKIAGQASFEMGKKVAFLSTDSYRVFGAQHLQAYAGLMGLPFAVARTGEEIREKLEGDFADHDLILVDTSGRSPRDVDGVAEIQRILGACPEADIHLALAANGKIGDLALALDSFLELPVSHLIFTKLDEAARVGGLFSLALKARRPISYLGTGQEVPDDIEVASLKRLADDLLRDLSEAQ